MVDVPRAPGTSAPLDADFVALYDELRAIAAKLGTSESLQPTALLHEAYLRCRHHADLRDQAHLRARLVRVMRHILVDHARKSMAEKRGAGVTRIPCDAAELAARPVDVLHLDDALRALQQRNERMARIAELRLLGGFTIEEAAAALGVSHATISHDWQFARAWLMRELDLAGVATRRAPESKP